MGRDLQRELAFAGEEMMVRRDKFLRSSIGDGELRGGVDWACSTALLSFMLLVLAGCSESPPAPPPAVTKPRPAAKSVTVQVATVPEYEAAVAGHKGKVVLVDFWATWCDPCRERFPHTVELGERLQDQGLVVITVSIDQLQQGETVDKLQARVLDFLKEYEATTQNLMVPITELAPGDSAADELVAERLDLPGGSIPHFKLFNREGILHRKFYFDPAAGIEYLPSEIDLEIEKLLKK